MEKLTFGEDLILSCTQEFDLAEFEAYCTSTEKGQIKLFYDLLNNFKYLGMFGNANPSYEGDWKEVLFENVDFENDVGSWNSEHNICTSLIGL